MPDLSQLVAALSNNRGGSWLLRRDERLVGILLPPRIPVPVQRWRMQRADDMLLVDVALHGLSVQADPGGPRLQRTMPDAVLVAHFQPQAIAEQSVFDSSPNDVPTPLPAGSVPVQSRHAGLSRLAFRMPTGVDTIAFTSDAVLQAMAEWPLARVQREIGGPIVIGPAIAEFATEAASLLPANRAAETDAIADRAAKRAAAAAGLAPTSASLARATAALAAEVEAAASGLSLTPAQSGALRLKAELAFAGRLVERETTRVGQERLVDLLPGLFVFYKPRKPPENITAIELPYRLVLSPPSHGATFSHARSAITRRGRTELWHTRLGERIATRVVDATDTVSTVAAIWSPDYGLAETAEPGFDMSLSAQDRDEIVRLTADETGFTGGRPRRRFVPVPAQAHRLMLSALGGWLDVDARWERQPLNARGERMSLTAWEHHAALGRDWFVKTVRAGHALPTGHRMVRVQITERRFQDAPGGGGRVGVLRKRAYLEIVEPLRTYPGPGQPFAGRELPFAAIEILTKRTPNLAKEPGSSPDTDPESNSFWPKVATPAGNQDFRFELRATDIAGNVVRFDMPLRFVGLDADPSDAIAKYNGPDQTVPGRTTAPMHGQPLQLAPGASPANPGDVIFPMQELRFGVVLPTAPASAGGDIARWYPLFRTMRVTSTALAQLTSNSTAAEMAYAWQYRDHGFDATSNKGEVLLTATSASALTADFAARASSDKAGGIVTPNFGVSGTSRAFGLVGGNVDLIAGGTFDPTSFFPQAKLFGGIDLKDILAIVAGTLFGAVVPKLRTERTREKMETTFEFKVDEIKSVPLLKVNERGRSTFAAKAKLISHFQVADPSVSPIGSGPGGAGGNTAGLKEPEVEAEGTLTWFKLNIFGCIILSFDSFTFKSSLKKPVDADAKLAKTDGVVFGGALSFVNGLTKILGGNKSAGGGGGSGGGGGGGSSIPGFKVTPIFKPSPTGLTVGVKLGLTSLPVGIFTLKNLMVSNAVTLPFDGRPLSYQFGFAERSNPFQLVVSLFGGGGFMVLGIDTKDGVNEIEAAFEFGAFAELDFGVASGAIYVKAGIYFYWNKPDSTTTLKGYVEMGGEVQVIGLISVSILMHLSLGYYKVGTASEVRGQATLVIEVEVLFFSASVNLTVERRFGGDPADPTFFDLIPTTQLWNDYADAFA